MADPPPPVTPDQRRALERALRDGEPPRCPGCSGTMDRRAVPPRRDVSYVRDRIWLVCPRCGRTAVVDTRSTI